MKTNTTLDPKLKTEAEEAEAVRLEGDKPIEETSAASKFIQNLIGAKPAKEDGEGEEGKVEGEEDGDAGKGKGKDRVVPAPKKKKVAPAVAAPVIDEEKLGASIGKSIAEHTKKQEEKKEDKPDAKPEDARELRRLAVLERMEKIDPERYKGLSERFKSNKSKLRTYADEWERANTGEKFDENADEHADFIEALESQVAYDDDDYAEALSDIKSDQKFESRKSELDERVSKVERAEKVREEAPKIRAAGTIAGNEFWKDMGEDFEGVVDAKGEINGEALKAISEADPVKFDIVIAAADATERTAQTIYMLANGLEKFTPDNPAHASLARFAVTQEDLMLKRSAPDQTNEAGQVFVRKSDYDKMSKADRARHWTFSPGDLTFMATQSIAQQAKANLKAEDEKFSRRAKARGLLKEDEERQPAATPKSNLRRLAAQPDPDEDEEESVGKPQSPSFNSSPKLAAGKNAKGEDGKSGAERFVSKLIG